MVERCSTRAPSQRLHVAVYFKAYHRFPKFIIWQMDASFLPPCNLHSVCVCMIVSAIKLATMNSMSLYQVSPFTSQVASTSRRAGASTSVPRRCAVASCSEMHTAPPPSLIAPANCKAYMRRHKPAVLLRSCPAPQRAQRPAPSCLPTARPQLSRRRMQLCSDPSRRCGA